MVNKKAQDYVKVSEAKLCLNCNIIFEKSICPLCDSGAAWINLNRILNRSEHEMSKMQSGI